MTGDKESAGRFIKKNINSIAGDNASKRTDIIFINQANNCCLTNNNFLQQILLLENNFAKHQCNVTPPSIFMVLPVIHSVASDKRYMAAYATSSGLPNLPSGNFFS